MSDFVVKDKRLFDKDGHLNTDSSPETPTRSGEDKAAPDSAAENPSPSGKASAQAAANEAEERRGPLPPVTFAGFIIGLASSALIHLGEYPDPAAGATTTDLPAARQTIDLLGLLETKTKGNLDHEEAELLKHLLYDLRVKFVAATK